MNKHPECVTECQTATYKGYPPCNGACDMRLATERRTRPESAAAESLADQIPKWYEGGMTEQMLDEAFAQIRILEAAAIRAAKGE